MFVREKKRRNKDGSVVTYLQLVENHRMEGQTRQRVLCTLGRSDDPRLSPSRLGSLVETAGRCAKPQVLLLGEPVKVQTPSWRPHLVWGRVWEETVGPIVEEVFSRLAGQTNERLSRAVYLMVLHRLVDPGSKCAAFRLSEDVYGAGFEELQFHHLYKALDHLAENKEEVERRWLARHQDLFTETDLVYFHTTSTYPEGTHPEGLAQSSYSRDHRKDRRQIATWSGAYPTGTSPGPPGAS